MKILKLNVGSHTTSDEYLSDEFIIGVKKDENSNIILDKDCYRRLNDKFERVYTDEELSNMGFTKVELEPIYLDCEAKDFNNDLTFSVEKYNARKQKEIDQLRIAEITLRLEKLDQDFRQVDLGAIIPDVAERKAEFITLHNELRVLLGKPPREYTKTLA